MLHIMWKGICAALLLVCMVPQQRKDVTGCSLCKPAKPDSDTGYVLVIRLGNTQKVDRVWYSECTNLVGRYPSKSYPGTSLQTSRYTFYSVVQTKTCGRFNYFQCSIWKSMTKTRSYRAVQNKSSFR